MHKSNLMLNSLETYREKHFKNKFQNILSYYPKERIIENYSDLSDLEELFTDDALNIVDIFHILTKRYCLSNVRKNAINRDFNNCIERLDFEYAHNLLLTNDNLRKLVLYNYIDNINFSNNFLAIEKTYTQGYDKVNETIEELNNFYLTARFNDISSHKTLKKSY